MDDGQPTIPEHPSVFLPAAQTRPIPFFHRLGVKHGIILITLVLMAMTIITAQQLRETLREIERNAVDRGRAVASAIAPLVSYAQKSGNPEGLRRYFNAIQATRDIDYVQVIDSNGRLLVSSDTLADQRPPKALARGWLFTLGDSERLDRTAISQPWTGDAAGVDVFVALLDSPDTATSDDIQNAAHLRIGVNFDALVQQDTPRVIWQMVLFTLIVAVAMLVGLIVLLNHILRPLRELHEGLKAVAAGNLEYQVPVFSRDEVGRVVQAFNATISRLRAAFEQIEAMATRDPLTNMPNRRLFDERIAAEAARSRRYGHPFGLIVLDLDKFKDVNDKYGHPAGDEVLRHVAKIIEASVRETDLAARIGGEEFAVLLPESGVTDVRSVAEKLRASVGDCDIHPKHGLPPGFRITISAGAACSGGRLITAESMMAAADAALYRSKGEGRNRVTMSPPVAGISGVVSAVGEQRNKT